MESLIAIETATNPAVPYLWNPCSAEMESLIAIETDGAVDVLVVDAGSAEMESLIAIETG